MKVYTDPLNTRFVEERGYDEKATLEARVLIGRIHFDDGYREAEKGETVKLTPEDFDLLESLGQIEPENVAADRDTRAKAREAKKSA